MRALLVKGFKVTKLWGHIDMELSFNDDVNILIGPNASGKTTVLNLLRYVLTADFLGLHGIPFRHVGVHLKSFDGREEEDVSVSRDEDEFEFSVGQKSFKVDLEEVISPRHVRLRDVRPSVRRRWRRIVEDLGVLVQAVWLPVSRRLPIADEEEDGRLAPRRRRLESVDERLRELMAELSKYRLRLETELSERYKDFQRRVLEVILYSKSHDRMSSIRRAPLTQEQKDHLLKAFDAAGVLDDRMRERIDEHFAAAEAARRRLDESKDGEKALHFDDLFIIPLIGRTNSMVQFARELEERRNELFAPLHRYEEIASSFLETKTVRVEEKGELRVESAALRDKNLNPYILSSGEKQILILLTQALLWEDRPVVYVVDEPELSLHVTWQVKLLESLQDLGRQIQIIVATHSPDIVGPFRQKVIDLGKIH